MAMLLCNLDPAWPFATLVHHHGLDAFAQPELQFWNAGPAAGTGVWGDWPKPVEPRRLGAEIAEFGSLLPPAAELVLVFNLPPLTGDVIEQETAELRRLMAAQPAAGALAACGRLGFLAEIQQALQDQNRLGRSRRVLALPAGPYGGSLDRLGDGLLADQALLVSRDPRQRLYELRLLLAMIQDPNLRADLERATPQGPLAIAIEASAGKVLQDSVMLSWPPVIERLLACGQAALQAGAGGLPSWQDDVATALADIDRLCAAPGPQDDGSLKAALDSLGSPAPWFFAAGLPAELAAKTDAFIAGLDQYLEERFQALNREQQRRQQQLAPEAPLERSLQRHTAVGVGLNEPALGVLKGQRQEVAAKRQAIAAAEQQLLGQLRGDLTLETRRGVDVFGGENRGYRRPLFRQAEEARRTALTQAQAAAARLAARGWFWGGLAAVTLLALSPVIALRGPGWQAAGFVPYLQDPSRWLLDLAWTGLFALGYLGWGWRQVRRRSRAFAVALEALRHQASALWERHVAALTAVFRYQDQAMAMRRLVMLDGQVERIYGEAQAALSDLAALQSALQSQLMYYRTLGVDAGATAEDFAWLDALPAEPPGRWLRWVLARWPPAAPVTLTVRDYRLHQPGALQTRYLRGGEAVVLTPAEQQP